MDFNRDELLWINNALNELLNGPEAIEEWEFHTRMGGHRDQVEALLRRVNDEVGAQRRADPEW
jgi:CCR4-NOT transcriptional regulation complex NOT5 subunit